MTELPGGWTPRAAAWAGESLMVSVLPVVASKNVELLLAGAPIHLDEALCGFVNVWWFLEIRHVLTLTFALERMNAEIIARHKALAEGTVKEAGPPLRHGGPAGTRKARGKRKRKGGRRH